MSGAGLRLPPELPLAAFVVVLRRRRVAGVEVLGRVYDPPSGRPVPGGSGEFLGTGAATSSKAPGSAPKLGDFDAARPTWYRSVRVMDDTAVSRLRLVLLALLGVLKHTHW